MQFSVRKPPPMPFPTDIKTAELVCISLEKLQSGDTQESCKLFEAAKKAGFLILDLQNVPNGEALLDDADAIMGMSEELFALELAEKQKFAMKKGDVSGYKGVGVVRVDKKGTPDRCEFFGVRKDELLGISPVLNQPDIIKSHRELYSSFTRKSDEVAMLILSHLDKNLHLPDGTLESLHRISAPSGNQARLLRFEPQPSADRRTSLLPHTDFGSVTVLFNVLGGLQILSSDDSSPDPNDSTNWEFVHPLPGCAIINLGDAMVKFTNGLLKSILHRVTYAPGEQGNLVRNSLGYFVRPEDDVVLKRLDFGSDVIPPLEEGIVENGVTSLNWIDVRGTAEKLTATVPAAGK